MSYITYISAVSPFLSISDVPLEAVYVSSLGEGLQLYLTHTRCILIPSSKTEPGKHTSVDFTQNHSTFYQK